MAVSIDWAEFARIFRVSILSRMLARGTLQRIDTTTSWSDPNDTVEMNSCTKGVDITRVDGFAWISILRVVSIGRLKGTTTASG